MRIGVRIDRLHRQQRAAVVQRERTSFDTSAGCSSFPPEGTRCSSRPGVREGRVQGKKRLRSACASGLLRSSDGLFLRADEIVHARSHTSEAELCDYHFHVG